MNKRQKKAVLAVMRRLMMKVIRNEAQERSILRNIVRKITKDLKKGSKVTARELQKFLSARETKALRAANLPQKASKELGESLDELALWRWPTTTKRRRAVGKRGRRLPARKRKKS